jgi:hypothetical protein
MHVFKSLDTKETETNTNRRLRHVADIEKVITTWQAHRCWDAGAHRLAMVEVKLRVECCRHSVCAIEVEEVGTSTNDPLLPRSTPPQPKVMEARGHKGVRGAPLSSLLKGGFNNVASTARQSGYGARVPDLREECLEEEAEWCKISLGGYLVDRDTNVCAGALLEGLHADGEVALVFTDDALKEFLWPGKGFAAGAVRGIEGLRHLEVLLGPLPVEVRLDDVTDAVVYHPGVLLVLVVPTAELAISYHFLAIGVL